MNWKSEQPKIVVVGSSSIDLVINTEHLPQANESIMALNSENFFGGKGANQAVAVSRLGAITHFVGNIGMDPYGQQIIRHLKAENINVSHVSEDMDASSGTAYVTASMGQNTIVVVPSANQKLKKEHLLSAEKIIRNADFVLAQLEVPLETTKFLIEKCFEWNVKIGLYASPAKPIDKELLRKTQFIVIKISDWEIMFPNEKKETVLREFPNQLFLRANDNSTTYYNGKEMKYSQSFETNFLHKMGTGDGFTSGFTFALCHENTLEDAVKFGHLIAQKVAQHRGSQTGLPKWNTLEDSYD